MLVSKVRKTMYSNAEVLWIKAVIASRNLRAFTARKNCVMKNLLGSSIVVAPAKYGNIGL